MKDQRSGYAHDSQYYDNEKKIACLVIRMILRIMAMQDKQSCYPQDSQNYNNERQTAWITA
jgi:hypothetical protein